MKFHLSIVLDEFGYNRQDLYSCKTLKEMDEYLLNFQNHLEIREKYAIDISEFLLDNMKYIKENEKKNHRVNNGFIKIIYEGKNNTLINFGIIYQGNSMITEKNYCFHKIRIAFNDDLILKRLYNEKKYLLSEYEFDLLEQYFMFPVSYKRYKRIFINDFLSRLEKMSDNNLYMYFRSLINLCGLYKNKCLKTKKGKIKDIDIFMPSETTLRRNSIINGCDDELFMQLYQSGDDERLNELYDIEEIDRYIKDRNKIKEKRR